MSSENIDIVILAGGKAQRLGGLDKGFVVLDNKPLIEHCIARLPTQDINLIISANRNHKKYLRYAHKAISDTVGVFDGPLAGIYSALEHIKSDHLFVVPCDMPFLPTNLHTKLKENIGHNNACAVMHSNQIEPLLLLIKKSHIASIAHYLENGRRSVIGWLKESHCVYTRYDNERIQFLNINTQKDISIAQEFINASASMDNKTYSANTQNLFLTTILQ